MIDFGAATAMLFLLAVLIACGVQVAVALGAVSLIALYAATGDWQAVSRLIVNTAYDDVRVDLLIAIPLFMLMGEFMARSGAVVAVFHMANRASRSMTNGAALAAAVGAALSALYAGGAMPGAAGFARACYGDLLRRDTDRATALGAITSGAAIGILLPPSVLMLMWGVLSRLSVGAIFLAMLVPLLLVVAGFVLSLLVPGGQSAAQQKPPATGSSGAAAGLIGFALVCLVVLIGIGGRFLSAAEAAALCALIGMVVALVRGMRPAAIVEAILAVGRASAPVLLLILGALLYAQALAVTGAGAALQGALAGLGSAGALAVMIPTWLILGTVLDGLSAVALTAAVFGPVAASLGIDPLALVIVGILVLEAASLAPPFGLLVFVAKSAAGEKAVPVSDIFRHTLPVFAIMLVTALIVAAFPKVAIWLPYLVR